MKLFFHGASVTQQSKEDGYLTQLKQKLRLLDPSVQVESRGYGGNHIADAGFLTIARDVSEDTDICFLEWSTAGLNELPIEKFQYMLEVLYSKRVMPVALVLARDSNIEKDRPGDTQLAEVCKANDVPVLDYRSMIVPEEDFRDYVHTTLSGATKYADQLISDLDRLVERYKQWQPPVVEELKYQIDCSEKLDLTLSEGEAICFEVEVASPNSELIAEVVRGPSSGVIKVDPGAHLVKVWDQYSHFERPSFLTVIQFSESQTGRQQVRIEMTGRPIDYSVCRRPFSYEGTKAFKLKSLLTSNCKLLCQPVVE